MTILIFGGTAEGRILAQRLSEQHAVTVCVATALGAEELRGLSCAVRTGRLTVRGMEQLAKRYDLVIDATHPYAAEATRNIRAACEGASVPCRRILREASRETDGLRFPGCRAAAEYLSATDGNILLTTGSKNLGEFSGLDRNRLYPRVLPTHEALSACEALGIPHAHILALQGPFSLEMNTAMLRQYQIRYLVTKDGGGPGGFSEKAAAARLTGAELILISRPEDSGIGLEELLSELEAKA